MLTLETTAEISRDGTLKTRAPAAAPRGKRRVVIVIDDSGAQDASVPKRLPDLADFRAGLESRPYPGNSVVDMRAEER